MNSGSVSGNAAPHWVPVATLGQLVPERPIGLEIEGANIGLYLLDDRVYALADVCTHELALLSSGFVEGCEIECPLHGARFDIRTGRCTEGPAETDVATIPVEVRDGSVYLDIANLPVTPVEGP